MFFNISWQSKISWVTVHFSKCNKRLKVFSRSWDIARIFRASSESRVDPHISVQLLDHFSWSCSSSMRCQGSRLHRPRLRCCGQLNVLSLVNEKLSISVSCYKPNTGRPENTIARFNSFGVEKFNLLTSNGCITRGHCEGHAASSQTGYGMIEGNKTLAFSHWITEFKGRRRV